MSWIDRLSLAQAPQGESGRKVRASQAAQGVTPLHRKVRTSGTERMSRALILGPGTGGLRGVAGVKTAKLLREARSNREAIECGRTSFRVDRLRGLVTGLSDEW